MALLWGRLYDRVRDRASKFCAKYRHIDVDDLTNSACMHLPKIIERYNPVHKNFDKFVSVSIFRACQDELRKDDPLGIQIPQRAHYPQFMHLSFIVQQDSTFVSDYGILESGLDRIDRGYEPLMHKDE